MRNAGLDEAQAEISLRQTLVTGDENFKWGKQLWVCLREIKGESFSSFHISPYAERSSCSCPTRANYPGGGGGGSAGAGSTGP